MRDKIENICEKYFGLSPKDVWDERVKKAASASLLSLFQSEMRQIVEKSKPERLVEDDALEAGSFWNSALDEYEANLINTIEEVSKR